VMAQLTTNHGFGPSLRYITNYSLFGALWLAFIISVLGQFSLNDGNYYAVINAGQNLIGGWKRWNRLYTCLILAALGVLAAWVVPYLIENGFETLASFISVTIPCATVIMAVDHFVLPRVLRISRPLLRVPAWSETAGINWPAVLALLISSGFGAYASGLFTFFGESGGTYWGLPAPEAWALAALSYLVLTFAAKLMAGARIRQVMGFPAYLLDAEIPDGEVIDPANPGVVAQASESAGARVGAPSVAG
jgi:cytosine permease